MNLMLTLEVPRTCHPPPSPQGILVHLQGQQNFVSTVEPFHLPGASSGNSLPTLDLAAPGGHQKGSCMLRGLLRLGKLSVSPVPGPRGRGTEWASSEHCLLGQPGAHSQPRPQSEMMLSSPPLLWGCYDSQEFANQTRPKEEFCPWPQKLVVPRGSALWFLLSPSTSTRCKNL